MSRCQRPGCGGFAVARVGFEPAQGVVVIDGHVEVSGGAAVLCEMHVARLTAPQGWTIDDRRDGQQSLFRLEIVAGPGRMAHEGNVAILGERRSRPPVKRIPEPTLPLETADEQSLAPDPELVSGLLDVSSPLLARAFAQPRGRVGRGPLEALLRSRAG